MIKRNPHLAKLNAGYLFPEIQKRKKAFLLTQPDAKIISLGIGDTTEPIPESIVSALQSSAERLGTEAGYTGYGHEQGDIQLRELIAKNHYQHKVSADEIFISDGSKCDIGRLQILFGSHCHMAVQDPTYPAYVDTGVVLGQSGSYTPSGYQGIQYLRCDPQNGFFPVLDDRDPLDVLYFCSPNNPTGAVATHEQLTLLVKKAIESKFLIIFDAAYSFYIRDPKLPHSIYDIPGAKEVAIELHSLSKGAGFTGVRLGWSVVPKNLKYQDGGSIHSDWYRIISTFFNGPSNIAQGGAMAAFQPEGLKEIQNQTNHYLENALAIKTTFKNLGFECYGGDNAPYVWVHFPKRSSWDVFQEILEKAHIIATPGAGFGSGGENFYDLVPSLEEKN